MRLIDADALLEYLMINMGWHDEDGIAVDNSDEKRAIFKDLIDGVPTVDAVPVKHGRWNIVDGAEPIRYGCSKCNCLSWYVYNFCPNCGAKMDAKEDSE